MAGPLSGLSQQVPFATTFQPGQQAGAQVRPDNQQPRENVVQARNAPAANSQKSETKDHNALKSFHSSLAQAKPSADGQRGSVLDITV